MNQVETSSPQGGILRPPNHPEGLHAMQHGHFYHGALTCPKRVPTRA